MDTDDLDLAMSYFDKAISIDPNHLLSQHAKKTFEAIKNEEGNMSDPTLFDYSMIKGTVDAILFQK